MKLRNRKTGEIIEFDAILPVKDVVGDSVAHLEYNSLAEFEREWEDYEEEEKEYYTLNSSGQIWTTECFDEESIKNMKSVGNYFSSREEAELAIRKLKALTEAKKDGLKIKGYYYNHEDLVILADIGKCNKLTLDTLFGKEID